MAGNVVDGHFPKRHVIRIAVANVFRHLIRTAARSWGRNLGSTAPALGSMTLLLLMAGLVGLVGFALHNLEQVEASQASVLHVYIRDDASGADINALWNRLAADPHVAAIAYTTKAEALQRAQHIQGLPQLASATDSNPFPASLDVQAKSIDGVASIDAIARAQSATDPVYPTSYDQGAYQRIQALLLGTAIAGFAFLGMLGFVAVTVTVNSIRAAIHARRDEIAIMQLVGAPRWMVRGPFIVEGAITGGLAGGAAALVTFGATTAGIQASSAAFAQFAPGVTVSVAAIAAGLVLIVGLGLGSGSSLLSLRRHMES
ncbi:MAG TPA: permease-like cell division protein FtsX [Candidatus Dormibacteraeota bacterium]